MNLSREAAAAARRFADANSGRLREAAGSGQVVLDVDTVTPGAGAGGNALVTVLWRGASRTAAGYAASYTPAPGDRVVCDYIDNQIFIAYRVIN